LTHRACVARRKVGNELRVNARRVAGRDRRTATGQQHHTGDQNRTGTYGQRSGTARDIHGQTLLQSPEFDARRATTVPQNKLSAAFERDGGFHIEKGEINVEYLTLFMRNWRSRVDDPPMESFAADALDEIDRAGSTAQFGYVIGPDGEPLS
jgi:hypothetical protein